MTEDLPALRTHLARLQQRMADLQMTATEGTLAISVAGMIHKIGFEGTDTGLKQCQAIMIQATRDEIARIETEIAMLEKPAGGMQ